jgi:hypothetical protein
VDFTGASGVDVMLVTTGKAAGQVLRIGPDSLTFYFPGVDVPLSVRIDGDVAVVGEQRVAREGGNLVLGVKERRP